MPILGGYIGKLLEVDLTHHEVRSLPLPEEQVLRQWTGCTGLGLYLLSQDITPDMRPTDPECPVFIMTGPLTGTLAPSSSNWTIVTLNGLLHYQVGISQAHGYWGAALKHAGWDGIVVRGASPRPVYLWIDDGQVELRDATRYWGQDTFEAIRLIQQDHGDVEHIRVACIGPAGENVIPGAAVRCDRAYGCHKGAPGLIWGAKKLKAIAVRGTGKVPIANEALFTDLIQTWKKSLERAPQWNQSEARGIRSKAIAAKVKGWVPGKNFTDPEFAETWGDRMAEDLPRWSVKGVGSWQCELNCHHETVITTGPMAGTVVTGYSGESIEAMGPNLGILDPGVGLALSGVIDGLGLDASDVPRTISTVMEAYNRGLLTREDTDGIDLAWGNYEGVLALLHKIINREGVGALLSQGLRPAAQKLGIEHLAVHIKGVATPDHDLRGLGIGTVFQTAVASGAGPAWQTLGEIHTEPDLGIHTLPDPATAEGKGKLIYITQCKKLWEDSTGVCCQVTQGVEGILDILPQAVAAAVGWPALSRHDALLNGERTITLQRLIALYRGYRPEYDFDISPRLLEPVAAGPIKGRCAGPHMAQMREEYYASLDWDSATGNPSRKALSKVGLAAFKVGRL